MEIDDIREWTISSTSRYCSMCSKTCCSSKQHAITFSEESCLELFTNRGIKVYLKDELDTASVREWIKTRTGEVYDKHANPVEKPAIIQGEINHLLFRKDEFIIYSEICPLFDNGCSVHDLERTSVCKEYPFRISTGFDGTIHLFIKKSCQQFNTDEAEREFISNFLHHKYIRNT